MLRDADVSEFGVRPKVATAAQRGGFVLLVGGSSTGKTRCAVEAVKGLLAGRGDFDGAGQILAGRADVGDKRAAWQLAKLLAERGDLDGLRVRADASDEEAAWQLAGLLIERGDLDGLRARADAGDGPAAWRLSELLIGRGISRRPRRSCGPAPRLATALPHHG